MKELIQVIALDVKNAIVICALFITTWLIIYFKNRLAEDFTIMRAQMLETRKEMQTHSENMGKATKAINGDMLQIRENIFLLKQDVMDKIEVLKGFTAELQRRNETLAHQLNLTTDKFEEKFGKILKETNGHE